MFNPWDCDYSYARGVASQWLAANRENSKHLGPITDAEVDKRLAKGNFLSIGADAKTVKGQTQGWTTAIFYGAPGDIIGYNLCGGKTPECFMFCIFNTGRGQQGATTRARIVKTLCMLRDPDRFFTAIRKQLERLHRSGKRVAVRLNGTTDLAWTRWIGDTMHDLYDRDRFRFYDYVKDTRTLMFGRLLNKQAGTKIIRYTQSVSEYNYRLFLKAAHRGEGQWAVVSNTLQPGDWVGHLECVDGDGTDLRFLDPEDCIVILRPKGKLAGVESDFIIDNIGGAA